LDYFSAVNGVKHGEVLSPVMYSVYIDDLLLALSIPVLAVISGTMLLGYLPRRTILFISLLLRLQCANYYPYAESM